MTVAWLNPVEQSAATWAQIQREYGPGVTEIVFDAGVGEWDDGRALPHARPASPRPIGMACFGLENPSVLPAVDHTTIDLTRCFALGSSDLYGNYNGAAVGEMNSKRSPHAHTPPPEPTRVDMSIFDSCPHPL